jgi:hypothetical protein
MIIFPKAFESQNQINRGGVLGDWSVLANFILPYFPTLVKSDNPSSKHSEILVLRALTMR